MASSALIKVKDFAIPSGGNSTPNWPVPDDAEELFIIIGTGTVFVAMLYGSIVPAAVLYPPNFGITSDASAMVGGQAYNVRVAAGVFNFSLAAASQDMVISVWKRCLIG